MTTTARSSNGRKTAQPPEPPSAQVFLPPDLAYLKEPLEQFLDGMVLKLWRNKHKKSADQCDVLKFLLDLHQELVELHEQCYQDPTDPNMFQEMFDVANYAFLMSVALKAELARRKQGKRKRKWTGSAARTSKFISMPSEP